MEDREALRPKSVETAVTVLAVALIIGVFRAVFGSTYSSAGVDLGFMYGFLIAVNVLLGFFLYKISEGRNWARLTYTVIFLLGLFKTVPTLLSTFASSPLSVIFSLAVVAAQAVAIALLFSPRSNAWFKLARL